MAEPLNVVYGLHAGDEVIRYVGQTGRGMGVRFADHVRGGNARLPVTKWVKKHESDIAFSVLAVAERPDDLDALEIAFIAELGTHVSRGGLNVTLGGGGMRGYQMSKEARAAMSARISGSGHPLWGVSPSAETRAKMSATSRQGQHAGENNKHRTLTAEQALEIFARRQSGETLGSIAADYGISTNQVAWIYLGKSWSSATGASYDPDRSRRDRAIRRLGLDLEAAYAKATTPQRPRPPVSEETRRKMGEARRGAASGSNKLDEAQVVEIKRRLAAGEQGKMLAAEFRVHKATISDINQGKTWGWLEVGE